MTEPQQVLEILRVIDRDRMSKANGQSPIVASLLFSKEWVKWRPLPPLIPQSPRQSLAGHSPDTRRSHTNPVSVTTASVRRGSGEAPGRVARHERGSGATLDPLQTEVEEIGTFA